MSDLENQLEWTTELDVKILNVLGYGHTLTPSVIADNIDSSRVSVSRRLNSLTAGGLVEKVERGKYEITWDGRRFIHGQYHQDIPKGGMPHETAGIEFPELKQLLAENGPDFLKEEFNLNDEQVEFLSKYELVESDEE